MTDDRPPGAALDLRALLATLARHEVDYTIVGGIAVQVHGHRRTTKDLDLIPAPDGGNIARLAAALAELDARPADMPDAGSPTIEQLATAAVVPPLVTRHGEVHVLNDVPGAAPYAELRSRALVLDFEGMSLAIAGLDDVIAMKRASGRERDVRDIAALTASDEP